MLIENNVNITIVLRVALAFLFRIGSILIQISSIPVRNVNLILLQNIVELTTSAITFFVFGYSIVFGNLTEPTWRIASLLTTNNQTEIENAVYAWTAVTTCTAIFTTMTAGRMHLIGYVIITALISGLIEPLAMHFVWTPDSYVTNNTFIGNDVTYVDFGSISHVHLLAGSAAFLGTIFLGRRLIRLKDIDEASLPPSSVTSLTVGYFLIIVGTFGLMLPYPFIHGVVINPSGIKCGVAVIGGILAAMVTECILIRKEMNYWTLQRYLQGGLAGMVVLSNGLDVYSPLICFLLGACGGICFYIVQHLLFKTPFEDYCNVIPIHFFCGILSVLLSYRLSDLFKSDPGTLSQFAWEVTVTAYLVGFYIACLAPVFLLLKWLGILRNHQCELDHRRAMKVYRSQRSSRFFTRLFPRGSNPQLLMPGYAGRREEYQDQQLTEEVEVEMKSDGKSALRKRRMEDDDTKSRKKANRSE